MKLTPKRIETLERLGFERKSVLVRKGHSYIVWEKEIKTQSRPNNGATVVVHVFDGSIHRVSVYKDIYAWEDVMKQVEADLAELRKEGIE